MSWRYSNKITSILWPFDACNKNNIGSFGLNGVDKIVSIDQSYSNGFKFIDEIASSKWFSLISRGFYVKYFKSVFKMEKSFCIQNFNGSINEDKI